MSARGKGRVGAILSALSTIVALFAYMYTAVLIACLLGLVAGVALVVSGARATIAQMGESRNRIETLMQVELERARRQKIDEAEQKDDPGR